ncbi:MAG: fasciclin domain-containing protein [Verrucomicrobiota bacterium]
MNRFASIIAFAGLCFASSLSAKEGINSTSAVLAEDGRFKTLLAALDAADLVGTLDSREAVTVLAPTDEAFALLPEGTVASLLEPGANQQLTDILLYHVVGIRANSETVKGLKKSATLNGTSVNVVVADGALFVNEAQVIETDMDTQNGVIHVLDRVLLPTDAAEPADVVALLAADERFSTLVTAVGAAGLVETLQLREGGDPVGPPYTVFAPTNAAFEKLPPGTVESLLLPENRPQLEGILLHHLIGAQAPSATLSRLNHVTAVGGQTLNVIRRENGIAINNASVIDADLLAGNGVVHGIDNVLIPASSPESRNLSEVLEADGRFTTLLTAVGAAGLDAAVTNDDPLTVLAPTDAAFAKLPASTLADLLQPENQQQLSDILLYHIVSGSVNSATVRTLKRAETLAGQQVNILPVEGRLFVNNAQVVAADIGASNGIVHGIDTVLLSLPAPLESSIPQVAQSDGRFATLLAAIEAAGLTSTISGTGPFTVLAPTDEAFSDVPVDFLLKEENKDLLTSILLHHVFDREIGASTLARNLELNSLQNEPVPVSGAEGSLQLGRANVVAVDIRTATGTIHVIDKVLLPPSVTDRRKVLGVAESDGRFTTLLAAIEAAGLTDALKEDGPFTILAPTDEAFAQLPEGTVEDLLKPENQEQLTRILLYHVVPAEANSHAVLGLTHLNTLAEQAVSVVLDERDHSILLDGARVSTPDVRALNGIIHVIDSVLLPPAHPEKNLVELLEGDDRFETLVAAVTAAGLSDTLAHEPSLTVLAPTDEAFEKLPAGTVETLLMPENKEQLADILTHHVIGAQINSKAFGQLDRATSLLSQKHNVIRSGDGISINNAGVISADLLATNGIAHAIDTVLIPASQPETRNLAEVLEADGRFTTLLAAVGAADLAETVVTSEALTILAPTDAAFAGLPENTLDTLLLPENKEQLRQILLYHVIGGKVLSSTVQTLASANTVAEAPVNILLNGDAILVNDAQVFEVDINASNGVIHAIDRVLLPPAGRSEAKIPEFASSAGFSVLVAAVEAAGLVELLNGEGPFTVLAPTDEAFAKLADGVLDSLLLPENVDQLRDILRYHVFSTEISASTFGRVDHPFTASGAGVAVATGDAGPTFNGAGVVSADVLVGNGIIHAIDTVLIPAPEILEISSTAVRKGNVEIRWNANRVGPYKLQRTTNLADPESWEDVVLTRDKAASSPIDGPEAYFRVIR